MRNSKITGTLVALCSLTALASAFAGTGCSSGMDGDASVKNATATGAIGLALQVAPGTTLDSVSYRITGPGGYTKTGLIDVSQSSTLSSTISPIPAGTGFTIALDATSREGGAACTGSAPFDVAAHQTTAVTVHLLCKEAARTGSVLVNGVLNVCATPDGIGASPANAFVGSTIQLSAQAHDTDSGPSPISYHWTASGGTLSDAAAQNPTFTCTAAGDFTVTMSASDGDTAPSCAETLTATVRCFAPGTGAGGAAGTGGATGTGGAGGAGGSVNVVVYRIGDGSGSLVNLGNPVFVDEFAPSGALVRSTAMPTASSGANHRLVASGTATSEGFITRSLDGKFALLTGYDSSIPAASSLAGSASATTPRTIGRLDADAHIDTTTALTDAASANNPRSAASTNGSDLWFAGAAGGVRYALLGASTSTQLSTTVTNIRQVNVFASQLYVSDSSGSAVRLGAVGTGFPTTAGQVIVNLPGISPSTGSPYAFYFADLDAATPGLDVLYVADDSAGVTKYSLVGGAWTANGTIGTAADTYRGITGSVTASGVVLYATRKGGSGATGGGELVSLIDSSGYGGAFAGTPSLLATAAANTAFRGVALAPVP